MHRSSADEKTESYVNFGLGIFPMVSRILLRDFMIQAGDRPIFVITIYCAESRVVGMGMSLSFGLTMIGRLTWFWMFNYY